MIKFATGFLLAVLLLSGKATWAEESSEHKKNISKAVSAQLLHMKLKKRSRAKPAKKVAKESKSLPKTLGVKAEDAKPDSATPQQSEQKPVVTIESAANTIKKPLVPIVKKEAQKSAQGKEKREKSVKAEADKKPLSSQQKNDNLRLKLQDLVNSTAED